MVLDLDELYGRTQASVISSLLNHTKQFLIVPLRIIMHSSVPLCCIKSVFTLKIQNHALIIAIWYSYKLWSSSVMSPENFYIWVFCVCLLLFFFII